jgi:hypothetical protein
VKLGLIVEGHGEVSALPVLLRRLIALSHPGVSVEIATPVRLPKGKMLKQHELSRAVQLVARKTAPDGAIMVILDADDDCPVTLSRSLLAHVRDVQRDRPASVVVANREYESWFLAGASGLRGYRGLAADLVAEANAELIRDAKGWLDTRMQNGYHETTDQPKLSQRFDLQEAEASSSFRKLRRALCGMVDELLVAGRGTS